ncbi:MAG: Gfo/Idh/MocA family oxidoreductase, partial [Agrobacterium sp.]
MTIKLALIGAGRIAKVHARAIAGSADAELAAVSDALPAAAEALARASGARAADVDAIAADQSIDAVLICTPT